MKDIINDLNIPLPKYLIKFGKREHLNSMYQYGQIHFSSASEFKKSGIDDEINDRYEGELFHNIYELIAYANNSENVEVNKSFKIADIAEMRVRFEKIDKIPFVCFYSYNGEVFNEILNSEVFKEIINSFKDYDTVVIIYKVKEFLEFLASQKLIYVNNVEYVDETPNEFNINNLIHCLFYKRKKYQHQKEFRIVLPQEQIGNPININFGKLSEYALVLPINELKKGIFISDDIDTALKVMKEYEKLGYHFGEMKHFEE